MPKINPLMFLAAPYAVNEFAVKPMSEIYGAYRGIKDQFTKDAENAEQVRLRKRQYDRTISDEDKVDMLQGYTGSDPKFVENLGKETTTALSDKQIKEIEKIQLKDTQDLITNLQTSKDAAKTLRDFNAEGRLHLGTLDKVKDGIAQLRNTFESAYKVADEQTKQEKKMKFQAEVAPVFVDTTMTPQQKVQFIYQTATKHGLDPDATLKDYMDMSKNTFGPTQTGAVGRTSFKFRTNELGKVDPIAQSVATVRGEGGGSSSNPMDPANGFQYFVTQADPSRPPIIEKVPVGSKAYNDYLTKYAERVRPVGGKGQLTVNQGLNSFKYDPRVRVTTYDTKTGNTTSKTESALDNLASRRGLPKQTKGSEPSLEQAQALVNKYGSVQEAQKAWSRGERP